MNFVGILIGTSILWGLSALVVQPVSEHFLRRKLKSDPVYAPLASGKGEELSAESYGYMESQRTKYFIATDVVVLSLAGFLIGILSGYFFIGISWKASNWPGVIAFVVLSIIGASIRSGT